MDAMSSGAMWITDLDTALKAVLETSFIPLIPALDGEDIELDETVRRHFPAAHQFRRSFLAFQVDRFRMKEIGDSGQVEIIAEVTFRVYYTDFPHPEKTARQHRQLMNALFNFFCGVDITGDGERKIRTDAGARWTLHGIPAVLFDRIFPRSGDMGAALVAEFRTIFQF